jgi:hydrogenase maturation protease
MTKLLLFGYGNIGRGDDALGPELIERVARTGASDLRLQTDTQLQVEHVEDLAACERVVFIDADVSCAEPFELSAISAVKDDSYTSHAMSPGALLYAYIHVYRKDPPPAFLLRIRGYNFDLGQSLSEHASANLDEANRLLGELCKVLDSRAPPENLENA